jgi:hypothetical protein
MGGDTDDYILFYFNINEMFTVLLGRCSNPIQNDTAFQQKIFMHLKSSSQGPRTSWRDGHQFLGKRTLRHTKILFESSIMSVLCDIQRTRPTLRVGTISSTKTSQQLDNYCDV